MINGLVDTTSIIHLYRRILPAYKWLATQSMPLGVVSTTWFEVLIGAKNKHQQTACIGILQQFTRCYLTEADQDWAITQFERFQFSHHIGYNDCLIAAVAYRLQIPLYTHNIKHMQPLLGVLAVQPYQH